MLLEISTRTIPGNGGEVVLLWWDNRSAPDGGPYRVEVNGPEGERIATLDCVSHSEALTGRVREVSRYASA